MGAIGDGIATLVADAQQVLPGPWFFVAAGGLVVVLVLLVFRRWMTSLRHAVEELRSGKPPLDNADRSAIDLQIQELLKSLDTGRTPTEAPDVSPMPPILPLKREWRQAVLEGTEAPGPHPA